MSSIASIKSTLTSFWGKYGRGTARTCRVVVSTLVPAASGLADAIFGVLEDKADDLREDELERRIDKALAGREQEQELIAEMLVLISENLTGLMDQVAAMVSAPGITEDTLAQVVRGALASNPELRATRDKLHELACKLEAIHGDVLTNQEMIKRVLNEQGKQADLLQQLLNVAKDGRAYASQIGEPIDFAARYQLDTLYQRFDQAVLQADADIIAAIIAEVQQIAPQSARLPVMRAVLALLRNQLDNMLAEWQQALELDPTSSTLISATQAARDTVYAQPRDDARDSSRDSKRLTINDTVGDRRWKITSEIGRGGMGSVYRVEDRMGHVGALKVMQREILANKHAEALFDSEVRSLLEVDHPAVVRVLAWGECDRTNHPYIVMELIEGQSLNLWLKAHGPMDESTACAFFGELADALAACHARNVLHRDVKPDNILVVERDGKPAPVLIDFGIAGEAQGKTYGFDPNFAATEVIRRGQADALSDVFSLGATMMYALASGPSRTVYLEDFDPEDCGVSDRLDELLTRSVAKRRLRCGLAEVIEGLRGGMERAPAEEQPEPEPETISPEPVSQELDELGASPEPACLSDADFAEWQRKLAPHGKLDHDDEGRLRFNPSRGMLDAGFQALEGLDAIQAIDFSAGYTSNGKKITDAGLRSLAGLTSLQSLNLEGCEKITDAGLRSLAGLTSLQSLNLEGCFQITDAGLRSLEGLTSMQSLHLSRCFQITDAGLRSLEGLTSMQSLHLSRCFQITDAHLRSLARLTSLQSLNLEGCKKITDAGLRSLEFLTSLQSLNLSGCDEITDAGLRSLEFEFFTSMQSLNLGGCEKITDAGLRSLEGLTSLQSLDLWGCEKITDAGLRSLEGFTSLQSLNLGRCEQITDAGLRSLAGLTSLQVLRLPGGVQITDAGLRSLEGLTSLRWLNLSHGIRIRNRGIKRLKRALPGCEIMR